MIVGLCLIAVGEVLGRWIPINRRLWTPSFTYLMGGMLMITLGIFYWVIDVKEKRKWVGPFSILGANAIVAFTFSEIGRILLQKVGFSQENGQWLSIWESIYKSFFLKIANPIQASFLFAFTYVMVFFLISYLMYRKNLMIRI